MIESCIESGMRELKPTNFPKINSYIDFKTQKIENRNRLISRKHFSPI